VYKSVNNRPTSTPCVDSREIARERNQGKYKSQLTKINESCDSRYFNETIKIKVTVHAVFVQESSYGCQ